MLGTFSGLNYAEWIKYLAQVRLKPGTSSSQVEHSTTEPQTRYAALVVAIGQLD